jgi:glycosyltransferase involved in cell wall biosynthesis
MPHAVDIFAYVNDKRNKLDRMAGSKYAKAVFAYGGFQKDYLSARGVPSGKIVVKPQSIDPELLTETPKVPDGPVRDVVFVGRFIEKKGIADLLLTAKRVADTDLKFHIYGYGSLVDKVREGCKGMPNVTLHEGGISYDEYKSVMRRAGLFFMPCRRAGNGDMDGLPTVFLEAAAIGLPVLTTDVSSIPVVIRDGDTGFSCTAGDIDCFEKRLREIAAMSPDELGTITSAVRRLVETEFHPDVVNNILVDTWLG